ncbi:Uncharacterized protein Rs2_42518 [Raphanus sativus]|nr:Uncharacterized protein Rs2_42518 [Raphanus sativus]
MSGGSKAKGKNVTSQDDGGERDGRSLPKEIRTNLENHVPLLLLLILGEGRGNTWGSQANVRGQAMNRESMVITMSLHPVNPSPLEGAGPDVDDITTTTTLEGAGPDDSLVIIMNTMLDNDKYMGMGNSELLEYFNEYPHAIPMVQRATVG